MAYSEALYTGDGVTVDYNVTFDYLDQSHVYVAVDKELTTAVGSNYKFEWINSSTVRVCTVVDEDPVPADLEIRVFRQTPIDEPAVVFGGGASLSSENLNKNSQYLTYALQEATDDNDAFTSRYLGAFNFYPATDNDGNTLVIGAMFFDLRDDNLYFWNGSNWKKGDILEASIAAKDAAEAAEQAALTSAGNAATSESNAASSASAAATSETNAANSASDAATSEASAAGSVDAVATSASQASDSADAAAISETNASDAASVATSAASSASTSASEASTSEGNAATSASNAATSETNAGNLATDAATYRDKAQDWAETAEDVAVETGKYSAKHWAAKAEENAAATSALFYYPENYGAPKNGTNDDTPGIQAAIDAAAVNGGTVYLEVGEWTLKSQLVLKRGAALKGAGYRFIESLQQLKGTILNVEWGNGTGGNAFENRTKAAVLVESGTKITDLAFDYPAQTGSTPLEYGPTIWMYEPLNAAADAYLSNVVLERLFMYRTFVAVNAKGTTAKASGQGALTTHRYTDIVMAAYFRCFVIDEVTDWFIIDKCEQQPGFLGFDTTPGASQRDYCQKNCIMFQFDKICDWIQIRNCNMWQGARGIVFLSAIGPFTFINCEFDAVLIPIYFENNSTSTRTEAKFIGCTFTAFDAIQEAAGTGYSNSQVCVAGSNVTIEGIHFRDCTILGPTTGLFWSKNPGTVVNRLSVQGCMSKVEDKSNLSGYNAPATFIDVDGFAQKVIILGNHCGGFSVVTNSTDPDKEVGFNIQ